MNTYQRFNIEYGKQNRLHIFLRIHGLTNSDLSTMVTSSLETTSIQPVTDPMTTLTAPTQIEQLCDFDSFLDEFCNWKDRPGRDDIKLGTMFNEIDKGLQQTIRVSLVNLSRQYEEIIIEMESNDQSVYEKLLVEYPLIRNDLEVFTEDDDLDYELEVLYDIIKDLRNSIEIVEALKDIFFINQYTIEKLLDTHYVIKYGVVNLLNETFSNIWSELEKWNTEVYPYVKSQMLTTPVNVFGKYRDDLEDYFINEMEDKIK